VPFIALMKSRDRWKSATVRSCISWIVKYVLVHGSETRSPRLPSSAVRTATSVGYLCPTLQPSKPASAISLTACPKVIPASRSRKSSFHHSVGVTPMATASRANPARACVMCVPSQMP
jgi:hypothetical protein